MIYEISPLARAFGVGSLVTGEVASFRVRSPPETASRTTAVM